MPADIFHLMVFDVEGTFSNIIDMRRTYIYDRKNVPKGQALRYQRTLNSKQLELHRENLNRNISKSLEAEKVTKEEREREQMEAVFKKKGLI